MDETELFFLLLLLLLSYTFFSFSLHTFSAIHKGIRSRYDDPAYCLTVSDGSGFMFFGLVGRSSISRCDVYMHYYDALAGMGGCLLVFLLHVMLDTR
jgi:hypothetical protein